MKKILVTGFPHCGTSILRAKLGEANNLFNQTNESIYPTNITSANGRYDFYLWKHPLLHTEFKGAGGYSLKDTNPYFKNTDIVSIIRNPYYCLSSFLRRNDNIFQTPNKVFGAYIETAKVWLNARNNKYNGVYTIRYEDIFLNNYKLLWDICNSIGLEFSISNFDEKTHTYLMNGREYFEKEPIGGFKGAEHRIWQMNQKFKNMNDIDKFSLPPNIERLLDESDIVQQLGYKNPKWEI